MQLMMAQLKQKDASILQMRKELQHALDETDSFKQRLQRAHNESQRFRDSMEDQMRNAMHRMQSSQPASGGGQHTMPVSGVVMSSSSQGQGTSPSGAESEVQKELQAMHQQCQSYEAQIQDKNHEL